MKGGLDFTLPNGQHTGYIKNLRFNDVHVLVKGGNPPTDREQSPPELGVGQYNVNDLRVQPSYGLWARHAMNLAMTNCTFNCEKPDSRYALYLDDVLGARISNVKMVRASGSDHVLGVRNSPDVILENSVYYQDTWENSPAEISRIVHTEAQGSMAYPR